MVHPVEEVCLELEDHGAARRSAVEFFGLTGSGAPRDPAAAAGRLAEQFVDRNRPLLAALDVHIDREYDGRDVSLLIRSGSAVGAIPLFSPTSARPDYGLVVQPRFPWMGIGPMLSEMGWRVAPSPLRLPLLRRSERRVPSWVLSSMVLVRMNALLDTLDRRFEVVTEDRSAPRGRIDWAAYATTRLPRAQALSIPCSFPDLRDDRQLKGAVRYTVEKQLRSLETQVEHGAFVHRLLALGRQVLRRVQSVQPHVPSRGTLDAWLQRPLRAQHFLDGVQGIEWTTEDRGLAGVSDLEGIPWRMPMDEFFEAWVETVLQQVAQRTGGRLSVGRKRETVHAINWRPAYSGSQRSLVPDFSIVYENLTIVVDAKYKRHLEELQLHSWARVEIDLREQHRHDLLQVLAYAALAATPNVIACLAYPCSAETWESLRERGRLHHHAEITVGTRTIRLWLTAVPMAMTAGEVAESLLAELASLLTH
jgi:hypothetical protein